MLTSFTFIHNLGESMTCSPFPYRIQHQMYTKLTIVHIIPHIPNVSLTPPSIGNLNENRIVPGMEKQ